MEMDRAESSPAKPQLISTPAAKIRKPAPVVVLTPHKAKVIPFPCQTEMASAKRAPRPRPHTLPRSPFAVHKVPGLTVILSPQAGLR